MKTGKLEHELIPKHKILNEKAKAELLKRYKITVRNLPKNLVSDPVVVALNGKVGDVIKIIRDSSTAGKSVYFRIVVKG